MNKKGRISVMICMMLVISLLVVSNTVMADESWQVSPYPSTQTVTNGAYVYVDIFANTTVSDQVSGWEIEILNFTSSYLQLNEVTEGNWLSDEGSTLFEDGDINNTAGTLEDVY